MSGGCRFKRGRAFPEPSARLRQQPLLLQHLSRRIVSAHLVLQISQITDQFGTFKHNRKSVFGYIRAFCKCRPLNALWSAMGKIFFCGCWECALFSRTHLWEKAIVARRAGASGLNGSAFSLLFVHPGVWDWRWFISWVNVIWTEFCKRKLYFLYTFIEGV